MKEQRLFFREWIIVFLIGGFIFSLLSISWLSRVRVEKVFSDQKKLCQDALIDIVVEGAVNNPGAYTFSAGVSLKEVIKQVGLQKEADRGKINFKRKILKPAKIYVPYKATKLKQGKKLKIEEEKTL